RAGAPDAGKREERLALVALSLPARGRHRGKTPRGAGVPAYEWLPGGADHARLGRLLVEQRARALPEQGRQGFDRVAAQQLSGRGRALDPPAARLLETGVEPRHQPRAAAAPGIVQSDPDIGEPNGGTLTELMMASKGIP